MRNVSWAAAILMGCSAPSCVRAGPAGTWRADGLPWTVELVLDGMKLTGTVDQDADGVDPAPIFDGRRDGQTVTFKARSADGDRTITFTGTVTGDEIGFRRVVQIREGGAPGGRGIFGGSGPQHFTARRRGRTSQNPHQAPSGPPISSRPASTAEKLEGAGQVIHFASRFLLLEETSEESANVSIGDLNDDGHLDVVLAKGRHTPLVDRVLLNDGHGRFPTAHNLGEASDRSYSAALADLDADGDLDVVVGNDRPDPKLVYLNDGTGHFHVGSTFGRPEWPTRNAGVADLNGDGLPDIIVANRAGQSGGWNYVCLNRGEGKFDAECIGVSQTPATTITPADSNGDGFIDFVVPHRSGGQSYVHLNDGKGGFSKRMPFGLADAAIRMVATADLNGDRLIDLVSIDEGRGTFVHFNQGNATFQPGSRLSGNGTIPYALAVSDLNLDRKMDIVVGNVRAQPTAYINDGSGRNFVAVQFGDDKGTAYGFAFGDLDKDGFPDIAIARSGAPNVVYFGGAKAEAGALRAVK